MSVLVFGIDLLLGPNVAGKISGLACSCETTAHDALSSMRSCTMLRLKSCSLASSTPPLPLSGWNRLASKDAGTHSS